MLIFVEFSKEISSNAMFHPSITLWQWMWGTKMVGCSKNSKYHFPLFTFSVRKTERFYVVGGGKYSLKRLTYLTVQYLCHFDSKVNWLTLTLITFMVVSNIKDIWSCSCITPAIPSKKNFSNGSFLFRDNTNMPDLLHLCLSKNTV